MNVTVRCFHAGDSPAQVKDLPADTVVCLDLDEFINTSGLVSGLEKAAIWVRESHGLQRETWDSTEREFQQKDSSPVVPCIVVIGSASKLSQEPGVASHGIDSLISAGAIFLEKPDGYVQTENDESVRPLIEDIYKGLDYDEETGYISKEGLRAEQSVAATGPSPPNDDKPEDQDQVKDFSIYENPPYQLSKEDFDKWLARMNMPDDDPAKDD